MSQTRFSAIENFINRSGIDYDFEDIPKESILEFYGSNVFNFDAMKKYLPGDVFQEAVETIKAGRKLTRELAGGIANGMKNWALDKGASHYAHWFQPLTGRTAEKHDSFFTINPGTGDVIEDFSGDLLAQQEPDGSSFPGGGLRSTFEARGYTAWDPTSPAFILDSSQGSTLYIPTIFVTYSGESLDYKLPLLKSVEYLEDIAVKVCNIFDPEVKRVFTTLGWEQEYFLIDEALAMTRPDLMLTGRTLVGKGSPKGQQLDDHYFGTIPERVYNYMRDLETECHKLGIPVRTRHNEVAPSQFELAPMFEEVNIAVDHNQLLMDIMDRVAKRHKLKVLLHEKPFAGVNGSGKHNNWSMSTDNGKNLLKPGKNPIKNIEFLTFFINTIMAVHRYADVLRASVASASNDHRLGANEAPPAIISAFIGDTLTKMLDHLEEGNEDNLDAFKNALDLLAKVPDLEKDNTDRNRTSPFAFTGNKFEIRMAGSTVNCAAPMTVMNTIVGKQLNDFYAEHNKRVAQGVHSDQAVVDILKEYITTSKSIRFEGDGYSDEWKAEAQKRGLPNTPNTPGAIKAYSTDSTKELFADAGVFSHKELEAHYEVMVENYILKLQIESRTLGEMVINHILPVAIRQQSELAENIKLVKEAGVEVDFTAQKELIKEISVLIAEIKNTVSDMTIARRIANDKNREECAESYCHDVLPLMNKIRVAADRLEYIVEDDKWPLTKYRELLFLK